MDFSIFMKLCSHHYNLILEYFDHTSNKPCTHQWSVAVSPVQCRPSHALTDSVTVDLLVLHISNKWIHVV